MKIRHIASLRMNHQLLYRKEKIQNKLSWNNQFIKPYYNKEFPKNG